MTKLKTISLVVITATLAGCAATPRHYDDESSRALNLARAGGIYDQDLRDSPDGTRSYRKGLLMSALNLASLATSLDAPLHHLSGTQKLLFNATDIMMTPDKPSARAQPDGLDAGITRGERGRSLQPLRSCRG